jgi:phosphate transport system substrate-binding protein
VNTGEYPIARDLYMYTAGEPSATSRAYLDWILGPEGQAIVARLGFVPLRAETPG